MAGVKDPEAREQLETLARNVKEHGIRFFPMGDIRNGIVHVVGPEQGRTQPGLTIVCGDSHTSTHGAFGALAHGIGAFRHEVDAVALEDSQVCMMPFSDLEMLAREVPTLQQQLLRAMSREIVRSHGVMMLLGSMYAEERLAAFLLNLTTRLQARGFSASTVVLRMSREEIGSYLGLKLETVSRTFSKFQANGLLFVRHRQIRVTDPVGLQQILEGADV